MRKFSQILLVMFLALHSSIAVWAQSAEGESVLKAREAALLARDLEATVNLFADDALVVSSSGRIFMGREQIRNWVRRKLGDRRN